MCVVDMGMSWTMPCQEPHSLRLKGINSKAFLRRLSVSFDSVWRKFHHSLFSLRFEPENCSHINNSVMKTGQTYLFDPVVHQKPYLFVYLYVITSTPCSPVCNNPASLFNSIINKRVLLGL